MKRFTLFLITLFVVSAANAQNITDGLRYATDEIIGTARFNGLSGAFGALGGDFSAIAINPAGSAVFLDNTMSFSFGVSDRENNSSYFNSTAKSTASDLNLNQAGGVFVFTNSSESSQFKKFVVGLNFHATRNYHDRQFVSGIGNSSIGDFFLEQAQGISLDLLQLQSGETISDLYAYLGSVYGSRAQNAFLGYQGYIFDPLEPENPQNTQYLSNIGPGSFNHNYESIEDGLNGKYTINFATQYSDKFYFGLNLNSHIINFDQSTYLSESNSNPGSYVTQVGFENNLSVLGSGFSAQVGAIMKVLDNTRIGVSLDTPTWYVISEETSQYLKTNRTESNNSILEVVNPRVLNVYEDYNLRTPGKVLVSVAQIFGKKGLLSFDYSYKDYSAIQFSPKNDAHFSNENTTISNALQGSSSFRIGGEYRVSQISLRGGFHFEESPYKNNTTIDDSSGFSLGLGYNLGNFIMDIAYSRTNQSSIKQLYTIGLTDTAAIDTTSDNIVYTLGFKF